MVAAAAADRAGPVRRARSVYSDPSADKHVAEGKTSPVPFTSRCSRPLSRPFRLLAFLQTFLRDFAPTPHHDSNHIHILHTQVHPEVRHRTDRNTRPRHRNSTTVPPPSPSPQRRRVCCDWQICVHTLTKCARIRQAFCGEIERYRSRATRSREFWFCGFSGDDRLIGGKGVGACLLECWLILWLIACVCLCCIVHLYVVRCMN